MFLYCDAEAMRRFGRDTPALRQTPPSSQYSTTATFAPLMAALIPAGVPSRPASDYHDIIVFYG